MSVRARPVRPWHVVLVWMAAFFPWLPGWPLRDWLPTISTSLVLNVNLALEYGLIAFSLVLLTGWVGQISLSQAAFVGVGAFTTSLMTRHFSLPFPLTLPVAALAAAAVATLLGMVALRVRGLYLAVATLIFAWVCDAYLFSAPWFVGEGGGSSVKNSPVGAPGTLTFFDFTHPNVVYLVMAAVVGLTWLALVNLRDSKTGRAFYAVRGSETAAVSLGIDVVRYKLLAFAVSGGLAGVAGNLAVLQLPSVTSGEFAFHVSLFYLSVAVVGGVTSLGGGLAAGGVFSALSWFFSKFPGLSRWLDLISFGLLLAVLFGYPGGLGALGPAARRRLAVLYREHVRPWFVAPPVPALADGADGTDDGEPTPWAAPPPAPARRPLWARRRVQRRVNPLFEQFRTVEELGTLPTPAELAATAEPEETEEADTARAWVSRTFDAYPLPERRLDRRPLLEADGIVVRFGGLTAVNGVSLSVREHEVVGLIGPNGAGKTTMFNAIAGLNRPRAGTVRIFDQDATRFPVHLRAQMGVGRTFQLIQLFPQLTVFDNVLVGTHGNNPTGVLAHVLTSPRAIEAERDAQDQVRFVIGMLGLEEIADRPVAGLPFGVLRQVEIARALVTGAPLLMLDEPASGLDNAETDELAQLLRFLRHDLGVTILLIEHDVRMVVSVCDYIYVMNRGEPLAEGTAAEVQRHPEVVAAYLGTTDEELVTT